MWTNIQLFHCTAITHPTLLFRPLQETHAPSWSQLLHLEHQHFLATANILHHPTSRSHEIKEAS